MGRARAGRARRLRVGQPPSHTHTYARARPHYPLAPSAQIAFYQRAGFVADAAKVENYYKRIANPHAIVLRRHFSPPAPAPAPAPAAPSAASGSS